MFSKELADYTGRLLQVGFFRDYCPNGLQVEGERKVRKLASGVSASLELLEAAVAWGADAVLVHHGYFWKGEAPEIGGIKKKRLKLLLENEVSLLGYHLPLDAHPELGNNALLGKLLGFRETGRFGEQNIAAIGDIAHPIALSELALQTECVLGRKPLSIGDEKKRVSKIAWCSGAAQDLLLEAASQGAELFMSGEVSERTYHEAMEAGICYLAAGHHATEKLGVKALGEHLAESFGLEHAFFDSANPV